MQKEPQASNNCCCNNKAKCECGCNDTKEFPCGCTIENNCGCIKYDENTKQYYHDASVCHCASQHK